MSDVVSEDERNGIQIGDIIIAASYISIGSRETNSRIGSWWMRYALTLTRAIMSHGSRKKRRQGICRFSNVLAPYLGGFWHLCIGMSLKRAVDISEDNEV
jgi:hypothetical protein